VGACNTTVSMTTAPQIAARSAALENSSGLTVAAVDANGNAVTASTGNWVGARATQTVAAGQLVAADVLSPTKA
jgi:hypothetical protein